MRHLLPALLGALALAACDTGPDEGAPLTCDRLGMGTEGTLTATVRRDSVFRAFDATCLRATVTADRIVIRGLVTSGSLIEGDIVLTALATDRGSFSIGAGQASGRYIVAQQTYEALEGSVTLGGVAASVAGAFEFSARDGVSVFNGEFSIPLE